MPAQKLGFAYQGLIVDRVVYATITLMSVLIIYDGWQHLRLADVAGIIIGPVLAVFLAHVFSAAMAQQVELGRHLDWGERTRIVRPEARETLGPSPVLMPEQKILFATDPSIARRVGRAAMAIYLNLPNYLNNLRELGFEDSDFADGGSDRLIDTMVAWGTPAVVAARVRAHLDAGADQVTVQVLSETAGAAPPLAEWRQAAQTLLG